MKFTTSTALALLSAVAAADYTTHVAVVCTAQAPAPTVTVTVTEKACNTYPGSYITPPPANPPYITTANGYVTSCDYSDSKSTVYVYPTGKPNYDATCAVYEKNVVISVNIVNINVVVNNFGQTTTITSTKTEHPTYAPPPPGPTYTPPVYSNTSSTSAPTGYNTTISARPTSWLTGVTYSSSSTYPSSSSWLTGVTHSSSSSSTYATSSSSSSTPVYTTSSKSTYSPVPTGYVGSSSAGKTYPSPIYPRGNRAARRA